MLSGDIAVVVFCYKRVEHLMRLLGSLGKCRGIEDLPVFVFSDGPRGDVDSREVAEVRSLLATTQLGKSFSVVCREKNMGLAKSVISGVSETFEKYSKVIVLEDDLFLAPCFLQYMCTALETFEEESRVGSVTGFTVPLSFPWSYSEEVYLTYRASSWSWATWKSRWDNVDWDVLDFDLLQSSSRGIEHFNKGGKDLFDMLQASVESKIDSWAVRWAYHHAKQNAYCLHPRWPLVANTGLDGSGEHCAPTDFFDVFLKDKLPLFNKSLKFDPKIASLLTKYFDRRFEASETPLPFRQLIKKYIKL